MPLWFSNLWSSKTAFVAFEGHLPIRIDTYLLPVTSPETNPMENLWRELKEQVAACLERSLEALLESCQQYFDDLSGENTLRTAGLY